MLFPTQRGMTVDVWDSIPDTTNAQESMHFRLYAAQGKKHNLLDGLEKLYAVAFMMEHQYDGVLSKLHNMPMITRLTIREEGAWIQYGKPEPWKAVKARIGWTKPTHAPGKEKKT